MSKRSFYVFVDESGQDTLGKLFIVSCVIIEKFDDNTLETLRVTMNEIETDSRKGVLKWSKAKFEYCVDYARRLFQEAIFKGCLYYGSHTNSLDYPKLTFQTIAETIAACTGENDYTVKVYIDGLRQSEIRRVAVALREYGIRIRSDDIRGLNDEDDPLMRLADAVCGIIRDGDDGKLEIARLMNKGLREGYLMQLER